MNPQKNILKFITLILMIIIVSCSSKSHTKEKEGGKIDVGEKEQFKILNPGEKEFLLKLARRTLDEYLSKESLPKVEDKELTDTLKKEYGCFVTLNLNKELRGCIGYLQPIKPLYQAVMDNAVNAAVGDPRFYPVRHEDLGKIKIEISVLSIPQKLDFSSPEDLLNKLVPLRDGIILKIAMRSSTFLPQVWESLPDKVTFMRQLSLKGGSGSDAWRGKDVEVYTYFAEVFEEEERVH